MTANQIRKVKKRMKLYLVLTTHFGFDTYERFNPEKCYKIYGYSERNAAFRFLKRFKMLSTLRAANNRPLETLAMFAKVVVVLAEKPFSKYMRYYS